MPGGATYREAHLVMEMLCDSRLVGSVDVVELNPFLDERGRTAVVATELVASLFGRTVLDRAPGAVVRRLMETPMLDTAGLIDLETRLGAHNYKPLDVVLTKGRAPGSPTSRATATSTASPPIRR